MNRTAMGTYEDRLDKESSGGLELVGSHVFTGRKQSLVATAQSFVTGVSMREQGRRM